MALETIPDVLAAKPPVDAHRRTISYLRVSITDRCNLRCVYCMPEKGIDLVPMSDILRYEEIRDVVAVAASMGLRYVRLTGGEPLARKGLVDLVGMISALPGIEEVALTTNGVSLARHAGPLAEAGLRRVNISLDTFRPRRFRRIPRAGPSEDGGGGTHAPAPRLRPRGGGGAADRGAPGVVGARPRGRRPRPRHLPPSAGGQGPHRVHQPPYGGGVLRPLQPAAPYRHRQAAPLPAHRPGDRPQGGAPGRRRRGRHPPRHTGGAGEQARCPSSPRRQPPPQAQDDPDRRVEG